MPVLENQRWEIFAVNVFKGETDEKACIAAGYSPKHARSTAARLSANVSIKRRIRELQQETAKLAVYDRADLLEDYLRIVRADANDLVRNEIVACRQCHGLDHLYQWRTPAEFEAAHRRWANLSEARQAREPEPDAAGGYGYSTRLPPHPDCPGCDGRGIPYVTIMDTTRLSPDARALYAGIEQTKDGFKVKMHPKFPALEGIGRIIGAFQKDNEQKAGATEALIAALVERTRTSGSKIPFATAQDKDAAK